MENASNSRIKHFFRFVFGTISYEAPPWMRPIGRHTGIILLFCILFTAGIVGLRSYLEWSDAKQTRFDGAPSICDVYATAETPTLPEWNAKKKEIVYKPLLIRFSQNAVPVRLVGQNADMNISLSPSVPGSWKWISANALCFTPTQDWKPDTEYRLRLGKLPLSNARLVNTDIKWKTASFKPLKESMELVSDPLGNSAPRLSGKVVFSHPVSLKELKEKSALSWADKTAKSPLPKSVEWQNGDSPMEFFFRSAPFNIGEKSNIASLILPKGFPSLSGGMLREKLSFAFCSVPNKYDLLQVKTVSTDIVKKPMSGDNQRILALDLSYPVIPADLAGFIEARELPSSCFNRPKDQQWDCASPLELIPAWNDEDSKRPTKTLIFSYESNPEQDTRILVKALKGLPGCDGVELKETAAFRTGQRKYPTSVSVGGKGSLLQLSGERKLRVTTRGAKKLFVTVGRIPQDKLPWLISKNWQSLTAPTTTNKPAADYRPFSDLTHSVQRVVSLPPAHPGEAVESTIDLNDFLKKMDGDESDRGIFWLHIDAASTSSLPEESLDRLAKITDPKEGEVIDLSCTENRYENNRYGYGNDSLYTYINGTWEKINLSQCADSRLLMLTNIGMIVKKSTEGGIDAWGISLQDGTPISEASYTLIARNGSVLATAQTDAQGHIRFAPDPKAGGEREPFCIVAKYKTDFAFLPLVYISGLNYDTNVWGISSREYSNTTAFLFSDRGIYRAGETVRAGALLKQNDWAQNLDGTPIKVTLRDPRYLEIAAYELHTGKNGLTDFSFTLPENAIPGNYRIQLSLGGENNDILKTHSFIVRDFEPDRIKATASFSESGKAWLSPKNTSCTVSVQNLYGTPARRSPVKMQWELNTLPITFPSLKGWLFPTAFDESEEYTARHISISGGDLLTDDKGRVSFALPSEKHSNATYTLKAEAEAFEEGNGRSVFANASCIISPHPWLLGIKTDGNTSWIPRNARFEIQWMAIDSNLKPIAVEGLTVEQEQCKERVILSRRRWGGFEYETSKRWEKCFETPRPLTLKAGSTPFVLPSDSVGDFRITVRDAQGQIKGRLLYTITGDGGDPAATEQDTKVKLSIPKRIYKPGETVELALSAPFAGSGIATLEREKVWTSLPFKTETTQSTVKLRIPDDAEGTLYATVCYLRSPDSPDVFRNPFAGAAVAIEVRKAERANAIAISAPQKAEAGKEMTLTYKTEQPCRLIIYAADEGILQYTGYKLPDPHKVLMATRKLETKTIQWLSLLLPEYRSLTRNPFFGGGDENCMAEDKICSVPPACGALSRINPFARLHEKSVVFWSGILDADETERTLSWALPDYFSGTLRIMALAVNDKALGKTETKTVVRAPIVLTPSVPTVLSPGDESLINLNVTHLFDSTVADTIEITAESSDTGLSFTPSVQSVSLKKGENANLQWQLRAPQKPGTCTLTFTARTGEKTIVRKATVSVRPSSPYETRTTSGIMRKKEEYLTAERSLFEEGRIRKIDVSGSPLSLLNGVVAYMRHYPHTCTEQVIGQAIVADVLQSLAPSEENRKQAEKADNRADTFLNERQAFNGFFGLWDKEDASIELSLHAAHYLMLHRDKPVAEWLMRLGYALKTYVQENGTDLSVAPQTAEAIYLLAQGGDSEAVALTALRDRLEQDKGNTWKQTSVGLFIAASYKIMQKDKEADALVQECLKARRKNAAPKHKPLPFEGIANTDELKRMYLLCKHFPNAVKNWTLEDLSPAIKPLQSDAFSTWDAAYIALFFKAYSDKTADSVTYAVHAQNGKSQTLLGKTTGRVCADLPNTASRLKINVENASSNHLTFFQLTEAGYDTQPIAKAHSNGLDISREYTDADGKPLTSIPVGKAFTVRIRVCNLTGEPLENIAVTDLLPGACETIHPMKGLPENVIFTASNEGGNIFYINLPNGKAQEIVYRIKAVNPGRYSIAPAMAEHMYKRHLKGLSEGGILTVTP